MPELLPGHHNIHQKYVDQTEYQIADTDMDATPTHKASETSEALRAEHGEEVAR